MNAHIAGLLSIVLWSLVPIIFKLGVAEYNSSTLFLARFTFSMILFLPLLYRGGILPKLVKSPKVLVGSAFSLFLCYYFFSLALTNMSATAYVLIYSVNPVISLIFLGARWSKTLMSCVMLALAGIVLSLSSSNLNFTVTAWGVAYIIIGMIGWAMYTKLIIEAHRDFSDIETSFFTHAISFFVSLLWWLSDKMPLPPRSRNFYLLSATFAVVSPLAYYLFSYALRRVPLFGIVTQFLDPLVSLVFAFIFLDEKLGFNQFLAIPIVILSAFLATKEQKSSGIKVAVN